jgi:hypothetical protein
MNTTLISKDNYTITISTAAAVQIGLIREMLEEEDTSSSSIPLPLIDNEQLLLVVRFAEYHVDSPICVFVKPLQSLNLQDHMSRWDVQFIEPLTVTQLIKLANAANYLDYPPLIDICLIQFCCIIKDNKAERLRELFNVTKPTVEAEHDLRVNNHWIFR